MNLSHLRIRNYRGLRDVSIPLSAFVCVTGENNSGKSSVLQALSLFLSGSALKPTDYYEPTKEIFIEVTVAGITNEDLLLLADEHRARISSSISNGKLNLVRRYDTEGKGSLGRFGMAPKEERFQPDDVAALVSKKTGSILKKAVLAEFSELAESSASITSQTTAKELIIKLGEALPPEKKELRFIPLETGIDKSILPMLPERIYIPAVKDFSDETKTAESSSFGKILSIVLKAIEPLLAAEADLFAKLSKQLTRVLDPSGILKDERLPLIRKIEGSIQNYVRESFSDVSLEIDIPPPEIKSVLATARILADDGVRGPLDLKGDGLRRAVVFSILRAYVELAREEKDEAGEAVEGKAERGYLLLFEEPELFLHPEAQRVLFDALGVFSNKNQVLITTHSPLFLSPKSLATFVRLSKNKNEGKEKPFTKALHVDLTHVKPKDEFQIICFENNSAAFFAKKIVLVEGDSDYIVFPHIAETLNPAWNHRARSVAFVRVGGKGGIERYRSFFEIFDTPIYVIADLDTVLDGFDKLGPNEAAKKIHSDLLQLVEKNIPLFPQDLKLKNKDIEEAHGKSELWSLWQKAKVAKYDFDSDPSKFPLLLDAVDNFFAWEKKYLRRECLEKAVNPEIYRKKHELLWVLRQQNIFILERGALDDYYPSGLSGKDKPTKAQSFIANHGTRESLLALCSEYTCPTTKKSLSEFEWVCSGIFK
jgi:putative ATP-dependent endonuclease of the OLD family